MKILNKDYLGKIKSDKNIFWFLFIITCISCFSLFMMKYIINGQDFMFHFSRLEGVITNIKSNNLFNGMYYKQINGYGYGSPLFYSDIFLYIPGFLVCMGFSKYFSYKLFLFLISFLSILFMYYAGFSISGSKRSGLLVSILYAASSYRLTDMFERCALGELLTFVFLPLVFLGIYEIIYRDSNKYYLLVIGMSGLILSHLITSVLVFMVLFIMLLVNIKRLFKDKRRILCLVYAVIFTVFITGYFLFPMIEQMMVQKYSVNYMMSNYSIYDYVSRVYRLLFAIPGIVYVTSFNSAWLPAGMGISFFIVLGMIFKLFSNKKFKGEDNYWKVCFIIGVCGLVLTTNIFPWYLSIFNKIFSFMQFPFRFLSISTVLILISFSICYARYNYKNYIVNIIIILTIPVILIFNLYNLSSLVLQDTLGSDFESISFGEYLPISDVVSGWGKHFEDYYYDRGNKAIGTNDIKLTTKRDYKYLVVDYDNNIEESMVSLPLLYYKGYDIRNNGEKIRYIKDNEGLVQIRVTSDSGKIVAYYKGTDLAIITKIISFISAICFVVLIMKKKRIILLKNS